MLVVDDGETNRALVEAFLSDLDCRLQSAENGPAALAAIEKEAPDLVLLDVQMPGMDGYEVCRRIKAMPRGRLLPVVMLTAHFSPFDEQERDRLRPTRCLVKPATGAEYGALLKILDEVLRQHTARAFLRERRLT